MDQFLGHKDDKKWEIGILDPYLYGGRTDKDRVQYQNKLPHTDKWGTFEKTTDTFFLFRLNSTDTERGLCQFIYRQSSRSGHVFRDLEINLFKEKFKSVCHQLYCNFFTVNMCIVYMYYCPKCNFEKRNYRRWPRFCHKDYCVKLHNKISYTIHGPCFETPCLPQECGTVVREKHVICPDCRSKIAEEKNRLKLAKTAPIITKDN